MVQKWIFCMGYRLGEGVPIDTNRKKSYQQLKNSENKTTKLFSKKILEQKLKTREKKLSYCTLQNGPVIKRGIKEFQEKKLSQFQYSQYLKTKHWKKIKKRILLRARFACELCQSPLLPIHIHHKTYVRRGKELDEDLIALCKKCHWKQHLDKKQE